MSQRDEDFDGITPDAGNDGTASSDADDDLDEVMREAQRQREEEGADLVQKLAMLGRDELARALASLHQFDFSRVRSRLAMKLAVQVSALDALRDEALAKLREAEAEARVDTLAAGLFPTVEQWSEPVDGSALLTETVTLINRYIVLDEYCAVAIALWILASRQGRLAKTAPILMISAPEAECGKTHVLDLVSRLVERPFVAADTSPAVLFRMIEKYAPTTLIDETDNLLSPEARDIVAMLNAGFDRSAPFVWRNVATTDGDYEPRRFNVFGFKLLSGIRIDRKVATITSRSLVVRLRKKLETESTEELCDAAPEVFNALRAKMARWAADNGDAFECSRPARPPKLVNRMWDKWRPLLAVADIAGGVWPDRGRDAAIQLSGSRFTPRDIGNRLLAAIRAVFDQQRQTGASYPDSIFSEELSFKLGAVDPEGPWSNFNRRDPITVEQIAELLRAYDVRSTTVRRGQFVRKGYRLQKFEGAFARYLPVVATYTPDDVPEDAPNDTSKGQPDTPPPFFTTPAITPLQANTGAGSCVADVPCGKDASASRSALLDKGCNDVTASKPKNGLEGMEPPGTDAFFAEFNAQLRRRRRR